MIKRECISLKGFFREVNYLQYGYYISYAVQCMTDSQKYELKYEYLEEDNSFLANIRRNLNVVTINEYVMLLLVAISILLLSGLIFVLANQPQILVSNNYGSTIIFFQTVPSGSGVAFNSSGLGNQYVIEMLIVAAVLGAGVIGLYLMKNATSYIDDQNKALVILIIGTSIFVVAALTLFFIYLYKETGNFPSFAGLG